MAIAFDTKTEDTSSSSRSSASFAHVNTGDNLGLLVFVGNADATDRTVSGVTYNGISMLEEDGDSNAIAGGTMRTTVFSLKAPASGSNTVAVNWSGNAITTWVVAISYTGCDQDDVVEATNTNKASGSTPSVSVTTITSNAMIVAGYNFIGGDGDPSTPDDTERWDLATGTSTTDDTVSAGGEVLVASPGADTVSMTANASDVWIMAGVAIKAESAFVPMVMVF